MSGSLSLFLLSMDRREQHTSTDSSSSSSSSSVCIIVGGLSSSFLPSPTRTQLVDRKCLSLSSLFSLCSFSSLNPKKTWTDIDVLGPVSPLPRTQTTRIKVKERRTDGRVGKQSFSCRFQWLPQQLHAPRNGGRERNSRAPTIFPYYVILNRFKSKRLIILDMLYYLDWRLKSRLQQPTHTKRACRPSGMCVWPPMSCLLCVCCVCVCVGSSRRYKVTDDVAHCSDGAGGGGRRCVCVCRKVSHLTGKLVIPLHGHDI